jgi:hypothetical protein
VLNLGNCEMLIFDGCCCSVLKVPSLGSGSEAGGRRVGSDLASFVGAHKHVIFIAGAQVLSVCLYVLSVVGGRRVGSDLAAFAERGGCQGEEGRAHREEHREERSHLGCGHHGGPVVSFREQGDQPRRLAEGAQDSPHSDSSGYRVTKQKTSRNVKNELQSLRRICLVVNC